MSDPANTTTQAYAERLCVREKKRKKERERERERERRKRGERDIIDFQMSYMVFKRRFQKYWDLETQHDIHAVFVGEDKNHSV